MTTVKVELSVKSPAREIYGVIKNMEDFPNFMRDVKSLKIIKRLPDRIITMWEAEIDGAPLTWKEENIFNDNSCQMKFAMVEGNYKAYRGTWQVQNLRNNSKLTLSADFDWGIPILEAYVGKALEKKARQGLLGMLQAIKKKVENGNV